MYFIYLESYSVWLHKGQITLPALMLSSSTPKVQHHVQEQLVLLSPSLKLAHQKPVFPFLISLNTCYNCCVVREHLHVAEPRVVFEVSSVTAGWGTAQCPVELLYCWWRWWMYCRLFWQIAICQSSSDRGVCPHCHWHADWHSQISQRCEMQGRLGYGVHVSTMWVLFVYVVIPNTVIFYLANQNSPVSLRVFFPSLSLPASHDCTY